MRKTVTLGDLSFDVMATFGAARDVGRAVFDPLAVAREAAIEDEMQKVGIVYQPKLALTVENVPVILHIGAKAAGEKVTLELIQEASFDAGLLVSKMAAIDYLGMLISGKSQEAVLEGSKSAGE